MTLLLIVLALCIENWCMEFVDEDPEWEAYLKSIEPKRP